ncbi:MAG: bifunctional diaminohydroxyphosphoribosylaminopyrimidine deaminase/5-amino-6-(5-phosphoribosylamino)uracil reductase RibD [Candidatus Thermoplasmatota archaeon]|nr:bifunctional diaminohydroxyphosphoribosylaminopyrimidine deaminase/5-amino-6-(5-phosphoribosylamino)uracil reductase RibD [Candidatus Thermoplasmatota archaeon]MEC9146254.1 bifunctional diaminohydroxyphosphoribosylaminopyrimidine deaminase/5-amino-6-(5-phosphoribosylamino)uracil reductase RibD [Candidatus Thermoplasmatota archaeon]
MDDDDRFMRLALDLGSRGGYRVMPNPRVGCVLVRDGEVIAEGWHDHIGGLHAEQMAIADAESRGVETQGSTAYVTLEPCNHFGRTPPCTEALLWAGIERVVIGALDPNPTVRGDGANSLIENGVSVSTGSLENECIEQMGPFMHWCDKRRPMVLLKAATDCNGNTDCDSSIESSRFTSEESLRLAHDLRADSMAILVGINTVIRDDPALTVRGPDIGPREQPLRVIIDPKCRIPEDCKVMSDGEAMTLLIHGVEPDVNIDPSHVERVILAEDGEIPVSKILDMLGDRGIQSVLIEGGSDTWTRFLNDGEVDFAQLCKSPLDLVGGRLPFNEELLVESGLVKYEEFESGGDVITRWKKNH